MTHTHTHTHLLPPFHFFNTHTVKSLILRERSQSTGSRFTSRTVILPPALNKASQQPQAWPSELAPSEALKASGPRVLATGPGVYKRCLHSLKPPKNAQKQTSKAVTFGESSRGRLIIESDVKRARPNRTGGEAVASEGLLHRLRDCGNGCEFCLLAR